MVGLAFERNSAAEAKKAQSEKKETLPEITKAYWDDILNLNLEKMFHYTFSYVGVLTGPYYTYRTFTDYFHVQYWKHVNCEQVLINRLKWVAVYTAFFLTCSYFWPISVSYLMISG